MSRKLLVTGGCGFIGSNFIRYVLNNHNDDIINLDALTYAGNLENLKDIIANKRYRFVKGDICDERVVNDILKNGIDVILNFAAESHVDRSLYDPASFIKTNIVGTHTLLELAREHKVKKFIQISTDEVYGSLPPNGYFTENPPLSPNSPYSASKTSADLIAMAYYKTFNLPVTITRSSNNYGPYQFPEKLIPLFITNALAGKELPVYGDGLNVRDWLFVEDNCSAIYIVLEKGGDGEIYNIGSGNEKPNIEITKTILKLLGKNENLIKYIKDRPGHDRRYALDFSKIKNELGWTSKVPFKKGLEDTINWYRDNKDWVEKVKSGEYLKFYEQHYGMLDGKIKNKKSK